LLLERLRQEDTAKPKHEVLGLEPIVRESCSCE
jgi:hypothetical protein